MQKIIFRILVGICVCMVLVIAAVTIAVLARSDNPALRPTPSEARGGETVFTGLGTLRLSAKPAKPGETAATVVLTVSFPYDKNDSAFSEELASSVANFREAAAAFIGSRTAEELRTGDEDKFKKEMLDRFNDLLRLGRIKILYFDDFMVID